LRQALVAALGLKGKTASNSEVSGAWDREYAQRRYTDEPPVGFVADILAAARDAGIIGKIGLYIGCGNGRNYLPLVRGGLDLIGLDISRTALDQLSQRAPDRRDRLVAGDVSALSAEECYPMVIGIQVFQHGDRESAHAHIHAAQERTAPGGLLCIRVNAVGTEFVYQCDVTERADDRGFTVRYREGPKSGLLVHFFSERELQQLFFEDFHAVLPLRRQVTHRTPSGTGQWSQWEGIWRRTLTS
jgi:hypothetical protein